MLPIAEILDVGDLVSVIWTSIVAGIAVCVVFSFAIVGFARATDSRERGGAAVAAYLALATLAFGAVMALVVFGVVVMTSK
jgi:cation transporter-like permease